MPRLLPKLFTGMRGLDLGVGFEHIDLPAVKRAGIMVTNTPERLVLGWTTLVHTAGGHLLLC